LVLRTTNLSLTLASKITGFGLDLEKAGLEPVPDCVRYTESAE